MNRAFDLRKFVTAALVIACSVEATATLNATAIVVFIRDNSIYLAADSAVEPNLSPACKIAKGPHVALALTGIVRGRIGAQPPVGGQQIDTVRVDLLDIARRVAENAGMIDEAIEMFTNESRALLNVIARDHGAPLDLIAAGFETDAPSIVVIGYRRTLSGTRFVVTPRQLHRCPPDCAIGGTPWAFGDVDQLTLARGFVGLPAETRRDPIRTAEALLTQQWKRATRRHESARRAPAQRSLTRSNRHSRC